jgi:hypothetical protein
MCQCVPEKQKGEREREREREREKCVPRSWLTKSKIYSEGQKPGNSQVETDAAILRKPVLLLKSQLISEAHPDY